MKYAGPNLDLGASWKYNFFFFLLVVKCIWHNKARWKYKNVGICRLVISHLAKFTETKFTNIFSSTPMTLKSFLFHYALQYKLKLNFVAFRPQANYTARAIAACRRS
jgi:hypothetical protein